MAGKSTTKAPAKASTKSAAKAAPAAAPAAAEQLANQPAASTENAAPAQVNEPASTEQPASEAPSLEAGTKGQEAPTSVTLNGLEIAGYLEGLVAGATGLVPLSKLDEPLLRQVGQFCQIEGYAELPPGQLALQIETLVGIGQPPMPAPDTAPAASDTAAATSQPASAAPQASVGDAAAPGSDDLDDEIEGLWVVAIPEQGFRRCGWRFTREGFGIALDALTAEQIEALENEPNLKIERAYFAGRLGERVY